MNTNSVINNEAKGQFEIAVGNATAFLQYRLTPQHITLVHTEVPDTLSGRGLGAQLVRAALDYAHFNQLEVVPVCSFVNAYLQKHPEAKP
jgi:predicted GNAT family acetyltransferase